jgi:hypothetical protein
MKIQKNILKTKKADLISIWWFFVLVVIGIGIVVGVLMFYSEKVNVRYQESQILSQRVIDCLSNSGEINQEAFNNNLNLLDFCGFKKELFNNPSDYLLRVEITDKNNNLLNKFLYGNNGFVDNCKIASVSKANDFPSCFTAKITLLNPIKQNEKVILNVWTGSRTEGQ